MAGRIVELLKRSIMRGFKGRGIGAGNKSADVAEPGWLLKYRLLPSQRT